MNKRYATALREGGLGDEPLMHLVPDHSPSVRVATTYCGVQAYVFRYTIYVPGDPFCWPVTCPDCQLHA